jgi:hypothetical protein
MDQPMRKRLAIALEDLGLRPYQIMNADAPDEGQVAYWRPFCVIATVEGTAFIKSTKFLFFAERRKITLMEELRRLKFSIDADTVLHWLELPRDRIILSTEPIDGRIPGLYPA